MSTEVATLSNQTKIEALLAKAWEQDHRVLTLETMRKNAPSVFANRPWERKSERYRFIPTISVVERMIEEGFVPVLASQSRTRIEGKSMFTKHMLRFRSLSHIGSGNLVAGDSIPELVLINSHDGGSAYQLMAGIFRVVCSNGMIVQSSDMGDVRTIHSGKKDLAGQIIDASFEVIEHMPQVIGQIDQFKSISLERPEQIAFAKAASVVHNTSLDYAPEQLLVARRHEDDSAADGKRSLWTTYNTIQENIMRGGIGGMTRGGRHRTTRSVSSVHEDVRTNKALWALAEEMGKLIA